MAVNFEQLLDKNHQSQLADEVITVTAAVISNATAPDFAVRTLEQGVSASLTLEQRAAAAALQAYGSKSAAQIFVSALDQSALDRAQALEEALEKNCPANAATLLDNEPNAGAEFKAAMCRAIAGKCAELAAAEIDRLKKGKITILNEHDQQIFDQQHLERQEKQAAAVIAFLSSLPKRYPAFGMALFEEIQQNVQRDIEEKYKSPDIHARVERLFTDARQAMASAKRT